MCLYSFAKKEKKKGTFYTHKLSTTYKQKYTKHPAEIPEGIHAALAFSVGLQIHVMIEKFYFCCSYHAELSRKCRENAIQTFYFVL